MKKAFKMYVGYWFLLLVCFNALNFLIKLPSGYLVNKDKTFWPIYLIVTAVALVQLGTTYYVMSKKPNALIFRFSLSSFSYWAMVINAVVGSVVLLIANDTVRYVGAGLCVLITIIYAFSAVDSDEENQEADADKNERAGIIITLRTEAANLISSTSNPSMKTPLRKVCEALRYSDPVNNELLFDMESNMFAKFGELKRAVSLDDLDKSTKLVQEFLALLEERNNKCNASN